MFEPHVVTHEVTVKFCADFIASIEKTVECTSKNLATQSGCQIELHSTIGKGYIVAYHIAQNHV